MRSEGTGTMDDWVSTAERVYAGIRNEILDGAYRPGERLDAAVLAQRHKTSVTPIREALRQLVGEGLVEAPSHQGFRIPILSDAGLRALYDWNCQQLIAALRLAPPARLARMEMSRWPTSRSFDQHYVAATEQLCLEIAHLSGNTRCYRSIEHMNAELRPVRRIERLLVSAESKDLRSLPGALSNYGAAAAEEMLVDYHRIRRECATDLVGLLAMSGRHDDPSGAGPDTLAGAPSGEALHRKLRS